MPDLHAAVIGYLTERRWPHEDHDDVIVTPVVLSSGSWTVFFEIREPGPAADRVLIGPGVGTRRTPDSCCAVHRSGEPRAGDRQLRDRLEDGEVRFRTSVDVEGAKISDPSDHLFLANIMGVEQYLDGLQSVIEGADPSAAIEMAENPATAASRLRNQGKVHPPAP